MGAWIEIMSITVGTGNAWSHPTMGAWIEIHRGMVTYQSESHPTMGAWIEIDISKDDLSDSQVAPHDGCVD